MSLLTVLLTLAVLTWGVGFVGEHLASAVWILRRRGRENGQGRLPAATRIAAVLLATTGGVLIATALLTAALMTEREAHLARLDGALTHWVTEGHRYEAHLRRSLTVLRQRLAGLA